MPRDLVKLYSFVAGTRSISVDEQIPFKSSDVRLIINETKHEIICSSMQKENITVSGNVITFASKFSTLDLHDEITIEIDFRLPEIVPVVPESTTTHKVIFIDPFGVVNEQWVNDGEDAIVPTPKVYDNLTFTEWNKPTTNITSDKVIGATYSTTDGKTYAKIRLTTISGLSPTLYLNKNDGSTLTVDWGDSTTSTFTNSGNFNTSAHNYSAAGDYVITMWISVGSGTYSFGNNSTSSTFIGGSEQTYRNTLLSLFIGNSVTSTGTYAFANCYSFTSVSIPNSVRSIGKYAFNTCSALTSLSIPNSVTSIGSHVFYTCHALTSLSIPNSVPSISYNAIAYCYSVTSLSIPNSVTYIENYAFQCCYSLKSVYIPNSVINIGDNAFYNCVSLPSLSIPNSVIGISYAAFYNCYQLLEYKFYATTPPTLAHTNVFSNINSICKIYVPDDSLTAYRTATNWVTYANYIYPLSDIGE